MKSNSSDFYIVIIPILIMVSLAWVYLFVFSNEMDMDMSMFGAMYALNDDITFAIMTSYIENEMKIKRHSDGSIRTMRSSGMGDTKLNVLTRLYESGDIKIHTTTGLSLPTGSISEKDTMFSGSKGTLGYGMQLGSGTYDLLPGYTYRAFLESFSWGFQANAILRAGINNKSYALGNKFTTSLWAEKGLSDSLSTSLRTTFTTTDKVSGAHEGFANPKMAPAFDTNSTGGNSLSLGLGLNYLCHNGLLKNYRAGLEFLVPVFQDHNGVQLKTDSVIVFGIQKAL